MTTFIDFVKISANSDGLPDLKRVANISHAHTDNPLVQSRSATLSVVAGFFSTGQTKKSAAGSPGDVNKAVEKAVEIAYSTEFLTAFSDEIGKPKKDETEDVFVSRAKEKLSAMLREKLKK